MRRITSRHNPIVARFRAVARGDAPGLVLLDGAHLVADALGAGLDVRHAVAAADAADLPEMAALLRRLQAAGVDAVAASPAVMAALSPVRSPSAIVALADRPAAAAARIFGGPAPLAAIAVDVQDPGNLGAIVRVAEAAGASGLVAAGACADPFGWKALRGSMGSALRLPIDAAGADGAVALARSRGCRIVATAPRGGVALFEADVSGPVAILIGGEGRGLPEPLLAAADLRVTIPMQAPVESLNAAVTAALMLYEARRQRAARQGAATSRGRARNEDGVALP